MKRWQKRLIAGVMWFLGGAVVLFVAAVAWLNQQSATEGLLYLLHDDVYAHGAARQKLEQYIGQHPRAWTQEQLQATLQRGLELLGDHHGDITPDDDDARADESEYAAGFLLSPDGYILAHLVDASPQARQLQQGDRIVSIDGLPFDGRPFAQAPAHAHPKERTVVAQRGPKQIRVTIPYRSYPLRLEAPSRMLTPTTGYYLMPGTAIPDLPDAQVEPENRAYVQQQAEALARLSRPLCGLVVDLRLNNGGVAYVMAKAGSLWLGPGRYMTWKGLNPKHQQWIGVAENGIAYAGETPDQPQKNEHVLKMTVVDRANVSAQHPYLAVLTGKLTASSGEMLTLAARRLPKTRVFGEATYGVTTGRMNHELTNGTKLIWSYNFMQDAAGHTYDGPIQPDVRVTTDNATFGRPADPVIRAAQQWLREKGCR